MSELTDDKKNALKKYLLYGSAALFCMFVLAAALGIFSSKGVKETARILSDTCFFGGAIFLGQAGLSKAGRAGIFDGLAYGLKLFFKRTLFRKSCGEPESYAQFREQRSKRRPVSLRFSAVTGCFLLFFASIFLLLFFNS